ncbi:MAG TPA: hypothetical protein VGK99_17925 [Acidobacteriota bacterium]|jgi:hypothetical protein
MKMVRRVSSTMMLFRIRTFTSYWGDKRLSPAKKTVGWYSLRLRLPTAPLCFAVGYMLAPAKKAAGSCAILFT